MRALLDGLDQQSKLLFETCLSFETLRLKQKSQQEQDEAALRERIEKIKLRRRQAEERAFEQKYMRGLSTARSALDPAEDLVLDIEDLKEKLFKVSLEKQQNRLYVYRLMSNSALLERVLNADNQQIQQLVKERDELAKTTISLRQKLKEKTNVKLECQVSCTQLQTENRKLLKIVKRRQAGNKENSSRAEGNAPKMSSQEMEESKQWLKHLLTGLTLEMKLNWAKIPELKRHLLMQ